MPRPKIYKNGTVTRGLSLSVDADKTLTKIASDTGKSRSAIVSELIMKKIGKKPSRAQLRNW